MSLQGQLITYGADLSNAIRYRKVTLTNAQIKALNATPKELVAAPGSNRMIEFVSAILKLNAGTNVLTESADNLAIRYTGVAGVTVTEAIEATGFVDASVDTFTNAVPKLDTIVAATGALGEKLVLHNTGNGEYGGNAAADATMEVHILYRLHK